MLPALLGEENKDVLWNIEMKTPAVLDHAVAIFRQFGHTRRLLITSFWHTVIEPPAKGPHSPRRKQRGSLSVFRGTFSLTIETLPERSMLAPSSKGPWCAKLAPILPG